MIQAPTLWELVDERYDLTDFEWSVIEPLLPNKPRGVPRVDNRRVLNGIMWVLRSGTHWRNLSERYGPYTTCYNQTEHSGHTEPSVQISTRTSGMRVSIARVPASLLELRPTVQSDVECVFEDEGMLRGRWASRCAIRRRLYATTGRRKGSRIEHRSTGR